MDKLLECVPNVSEGRDSRKIELLAQSIRKTKGVKLLDIDSGNVANRTVFTFSGEPQAVIEGAFQLYCKACELIDMTQHRGIHPRLGAVDVCPLVPLAGMDMREVVGLSHILGKTVGKKLGIPGYYYEFSAKDPERKNLAKLRKDEYESLPAKFTYLPPDFGKTDELIWARSGATAIGARKLLIAYNVNLNTKEIGIARQIAEKVRESGKIVIQSDGRKPQIKGKLKSVKSLGWYSEDYQKAQVSYNLTDINQAGLLDVFLATKTEAEALSIEVTGSELIGLAPLSEFVKAGEYFAAPGRHTKRLIQSAVQGLGLDELGAFDPQLKIIEYALNNLQ